MNIIDHIGMIWAIARKDIGEALKSHVLLSVMLGVLVLVGSSQIGVILQELTGNQIAYVYDTTGSDLVYRLDLPSTLRLIAANSEEALTDALANSPGNIAGMTLSLDGQAVIIQTYYAHWVDRTSVDAVVDMTVQLLQGSLEQEVIVQSDNISVYPDSTTNQLVNSMSIIVIIALFGFCGSLMPVLIVEEKRRKTLDVLLLSPASVGDIIAGKAVAGLFYGVLASCVTALILQHYILHWGVAIVAFLLAMALAVVSGLLLGTLINSYQSMNLYAAGLLIFLLSPVIVELLGFDIAESIAALLRWLPVPALMSILQMMYTGLVEIKTLILSTGTVIAWIGAIAMMATGIAARTTE